MTRWSALAAVCGIAMRVSGCSLYSPLPEPMTDEEVRALVELGRREYWSAIAPGEPYPDVEVVAAPLRDEAWDLVLECVGAMDLPGVTVAGRGVLSDGESTKQEIERAVFVCGAAYRWTIPTRIVTAPYLTWSPYAELARQPLSSRDWRRLDAECAPPPLEYVANPRS